MSKIVAFCGAKGSGKSTSATILQDLLPGKTEELAFAGHLKKVCSEVFEVPMECFIDPALKEKELESWIHLSGKKILEVFEKFDVTTYDTHTNVTAHVGRVFDTPRKLLQYIGTNLLHPVNPLIHVEITLKNKDPNKVSILTDLRFIQEFDYIANNFPDAVLVYVKNHTAELASEKDGHSSERQFLNFRDRCQLINNDGTITELQRKIEELATTL